MEVWFGIVWAVGTLVCLVLYGYDLGVRGQRVVSIDVLVWVVISSALLWWAIIPLDVGERIGLRRMTRQMGKEKPKDGPVG